jgi:hypothetical protein
MLLCWLRTHKLTLPTELIQGYKPFCSALFKAGRPVSLAPTYLPRIGPEIMRIQICCPHCDSKAVARSSKALSATLREIFYQCVDPECGHTYVANLEIVRTLSPSAKPNSAISLPSKQVIKFQAEART